MVSDAHAPKVIAAAARGYREFMPTLVGSEVDVVTLNGKQMVQDQPIRQPRARWRIVDIADSCQRRRPLNAAVWV